MQIPKIDTVRSGWWLLAMWLVALVLFRAIPQLDTFTTGLFWRGSAGFSVITNPLWEWLRQRLWGVSVALCIMSLFAWLLAGWHGRPVFGWPARIWGFVFGLYCLGPVLIVNAIFKAHSGRARPVDVDLFGGTRHFSIAGDFTDQCRQNCSFVSGESSAAVALMIVIWLGAEMARKRLPRWGLIYLRVIGAGIALFIMVQRIATGRHFLSDVLFAGLITATVAWLLWGAIFNGWAARVTQRLRAISCRVSV